MSEAANKTEHVLSIFKQISAIPRKSKDEERIRAWLLSWAKDRGFSSATDAIGNIVIDIPATAGMEKVETVVLQGHMDMVCEKNAATKHDFEQDPLKLKVNGDWVTAEGTTLGADNGIGVAAALALVEDPRIEHGPLELLLTVDEETGLTGAKDLDASIVSGRIMLNLDTEEDGAVYMGCAGGAAVRVRVNGAEVVVADLGEIDFVGMERVARVPSSPTRLTTTPEVGVRPSA